MHTNRFHGLFGAIAIAVSALLAPPAGAAGFEGFGQDIPLESAARQIAPEGWNVDFGDGVDRKAAISWSSASDWKSALSAAVARKGYVAQYGASTVVIAKGRVASAPERGDKPSRSAKAPERPRADKPASRPPVSRAEPIREVGGGGFVMTSLASGPAPAAAERDGWKPYAGKATKDGKDSPARPTGLVVAEGDNLRSALDAWAQANGWKVIWKSDFIYPIAASATFQGDFIQAATSLIEAMKDARPAINADFFRGNKVVVISNTSADEAN